MGALSAASIAGEVPAAKLAEFVQSAIRGDSIRFWKKETPTQKE